MNAFNQNIRIQQYCSWSEFMNEILSMCNGTEKNVVHRSANTLYKFFESKYSAEECLLFIRGGRI